MRTSYSCETRPVYMYVYKCNAPTLILASCQLPLTNMIIIPSMLSSTLPPRGLSPYRLCASDLQAQRSIHALTFIKCAQRQASGFTSSRRSENIYKFYFIFCKKKKNLLVFPKKKIPKVFVLSATC